MHGILRLGRALVAALGLAGLAACATQYRDHGYTPPETELENVIVGVDTRGSVEETIGRPSSTGVLEDSAWYYVSSRMRHFGALKPKEVQREIVAISFDDADVVSNVERFGLEDGRVVALSRRVTETSIRDMTLLEQLTRNFGRLGLADTIGGGQPGPNG
ncbi:outer membrane protein assembly factor BamE [Maritimibacter sp. 55A14]|uniref:outer membrane protein assembly factor BamE n=1 Tax=Maritimibacter sp. 55A14 TaxID=2174844 RepID=UPI000D611FD3|nr:outer membrane protein assembly factor BamE [Maritimibacter sp. 55A14]PWE33962.1 outer membrane protein assembly factor BamE [Maritimibacter sp. 55A14]